MSLNSCIDFAILSTLMSNIPTVIDPTEAMTMAATTQFANFKLTKYVPAHFQDFKVTELSGLLPSVQSASLLPKLSQ